MNLIEISLMKSDPHGFPRGCWTGETNQMKSAQCRCFRIIAFTKEEARRYLLTRHPSRPAAALLDVLRVRGRSRPSNSARIALVAVDVKGIY